MLAPDTRPVLSLASTCAGLFLIGCAQIPRPEPDIPRVQLEVSVVMDDSFAAKLAGIDETFKADVAEQVKLIADVEDRFYATLSSEYTSRQPRPDYLMTVELGSFEATIEEESKQLEKNVEKQSEKESEKEDEKKGGEVAEQGGKVAKSITRWVGKVCCSATVKLHRRQENGPALLVDHGKATVKVDIRRPDPDKSMGSAIAVNAAGGAEPVQVPKDEVIEAIERALRKSLRPMVTSIDRELRLHANQDKPPASSK